jgi:predicted secreted protein
MKFSAPFRRLERFFPDRVLARARKGLVPTLVGLALLGGAPARAQFFFPFFDNRPSHPPSAAARHPAHRSEREAVEPRPKAHRAKERAKAEKARKSSKSAKAGPARVEAAAPVVEGPPPPYEPQLLRLSEIMGALAWLQTVCIEPTARFAVAASSAGEAALSSEAPWRDRIQDLMSAEGAGPARREKLAGAFNRGLRGYQFSYRVCTPSALLARRRFLDEGGQIAHDISTQYRAN